MRLPKNISSLAYISYPFGLAKGLPNSQLLCGDLDRQQLQEVLSQHKEITVSSFFEKYDAFDQARILLHPQYFEEENGVKMFLFVRETQEEIEYIKDIVLDYRMRSS